MADYASLLGWNQPDNLINDQVNNAGSIVPGMNWQTQMPTMGGEGANAGGGFMDGLLGGTDAEGITSQGWGGLALGAGQGLFNGWMGLKQLGLAKDRLKENKRQFDMNWGAQKNLTNSRLEDRQIRRASANPNAQDPSAYMSKWGVK